MLCVIGVLKCEKCGKHNYLETFAVLYFEAYRDQELGWILVESQACNNTPIKIIIQNLHGR